MENEEPTCPNCGAGTVLVELLPYGLSPDRRMRVCDVCGWEANICALCGQGEQLPYANYCLSCAQQGSLEVPQ